MPNIERMSGVRRRGKILYATGLLSFISMSGALANAVPPLRGKLVDPVRAELCDKQQQAQLGKLGNRVLGAVNCKLYLAAKTPQVSVPFVLKGSEEIGKWVRFSNIDQSRSRTIDKSKASVDANVVTRIVLPDLLSAQGATSVAGIWKVAGQNNAPLDISKIQFRTIMPDVATSTKDGKPVCATNATDPLFEGCIDTSLKTGFFNGLPLIGADNKGNLPRAILETLDIIANDVNCPVQSVLVPALSEPGKPPITPHEAVATLVRAHIRSVGYFEQHIAPQNVDVAIDNVHQFTLGPDINQAYSTAKQTYGFMPTVTFQPDYCVGSTNLFSGNDGKLDLSWVRNMGAVQVANGFDPNTNTMHPNDPNLQRAG